MGKKLADEGDEVRIKVIWPDIIIEIPQFYACVYTFTYKIVHTRVCIYVICDPICVLYTDFNRCVSVHEYT